MTNKMRRILSMALAIIMISNTSLMTVFAAESIENASLDLSGIEQPAAEDPAAEDPAAEDPAAEDPAAEDPAAEDPAAEDPAAEDPAAEDPEAEDPAAEDPAAEDPAAEDPAVEDPAAEDPAPQDPAAEDPAPQDPAVLDPTVGEPLPPTDQPPAQPVVDPVCTCEPVDGIHDAACPLYVAPVVCTCDAIDGIHDATCPLYVAPLCTCEAVDGIHDLSCPLYVAPICTCESVDGIHDATCPLYVAPVVCTCDAVDGIHAPTCPLYVAPLCTCEPVNGIHAPTCPLYVAPLCTCQPVNGIHDPSCPLYVAPILTVFSFKPRVLAETGNADDARPPHNLRFAPGGGSSFGDSFDDQLNTFEKGFYDALVNNIVSAPTNTAFVIPLAFTGSTGFILPADLAQFPYTFNIDGSAPDYDAVNGYNDAMDALQPMVQRAIDAVIKEYPVLFWLKLGGTGSSFAMEDYQYQYLAPLTMTMKSLKFTPVVKDDNGYSLIEAIADKNSLDAAVAAFPISGDTDYEKIKSIHDQLAADITYNTPALNNPGSTLYMHAHEATGALINTNVNYSVVCEGYAKAFKLLLDRIGITNILVIGQGYTAPSVGESHMWNYVQLNGTWYAIDLTWNDQSPIIYDYFLVGSGTQPVKPGLWETPFINSHVPSGFFSLGAYTDEFEYPSLNGFAYVLPKILTSIAVTTPITKSTYYIGQDIDPAGLVITATYDDTSTAEVYALLTGFDSTTLGTKTVTVSYTEDAINKTTTFTVTVVPLPTVYDGVDYAPVFDAIYYLDNNSDLQSAFGTDYDGALLHFVNSGMAEGREAKSSFIVSYYRSNYPDLENVFGEDLKAYYLHYVQFGYGEGRVANATLKTLTGISVTTPITKNTYYVGESLDTAGLVVTAAYDDASTAVVNAQLTGFDSATAGIKTVTASYTQGSITRTTTFNVTVITKTLASIAVTTHPTKTTYYINHAFNSAGLVVTATYDNASTANVTSSVSIDGFNSTTTGTNTITVSYTEGAVTRTSTFDVTIAPPPTVYDGVDYSPVFDAIYYLDNNSDIKSAFGTDYDGALLHFVNNGMAEGRQAKSGFILFNYRNNNADLVSVYGEDQKAYYLHYALYGYAEGRVADKLLPIHEGVNYSPVFDAIYYLDNNSDIKSAFGTDYYQAFMHFINNGMSEGRLAIADFNPFYYRSNYTDLEGVYGEDLKAYYSHYTLYGKNEGRVADRILKTLTGISVTTPITKSTYYIGDELDRTGLVITADYDDASTAVVNAQLTGFDSVTAGVKTVTASYTRGGITRTTTFDVTVITKTLTSIAVTTPPTKTTYYVNHAFNSAGLVVTATYDNASTANVTSSVSIDGFDSSTKGTITLTVSYTEGSVTMTDIFDVEIAPPPTVHEGVDYKLVFDAIYYLDNNSDIKSAFGIDYDGALLHFVNNGMSEGRQAIAGFNVSYYRSNYSDIESAFGADLKSCYLHYISNGKSEGRVANQPLPIYDGVDYSLVFDAIYYLNKYSDLKSAFGTDYTQALAHFVNNGMAEGRQAKISFSQSFYRSYYADLDAAFGGDLKQYYMHYINHGKSEGRYGSQA